MSRERSNRKILRFAILVLILAVAIPEARPSSSQNFARMQRPYSCRLFDDEQRKCAFGSCDKRTVHRLRNECLRDGGRP